MLNHSLLLSAGARSFLRHAFSDCDDDTRAAAALRLDSLFV
jgi:hypothetical protein